MDSFNARNMTRSSITNSSDDLLSTTFRQLSLRAITAAIPTSNATNEVGIALTTQSPCLGGISNLHRLNVQLALALTLKDLVIKRSHHHLQNLPLFSNTSTNNGLHIPQLEDKKVGSIPKLGT